MKEKICLLLLLGIFTFSHSVQSQKKAVLAPAPPMGWNSWNWFGKKDIDEKTVKEVIDAMVDEGLVAAGYNYLVVDGGWRDSSLTADGYLKPHPVKFPSGIKALSDYAHARGLKFGLHTVPGVFDCGNDRVGAFGQEEKHISQFVGWELDFIKVDRCKMDITVKEGHRGWTPDVEKPTYEKWSRLLANCGRDITFSISAYRFEKWYPEVCNMARTTGDMPCKSNSKARFDKNSKKPLSIMQIADTNNKWAEFAGNGYWNDPDIMALGNQGLTVDEQKTHFALWCIMTAPLFLGNDPRHMTKEEKEIILNKECIAVNQDPSEQGKRVIKEENGREVWVKNLSGNRKAVLLLNRGDQVSEISFTAAEIGLKGKASLRDLYAKADLGKFSGTYTRKLEPHACVFLILKS